MSVSNVLHYAPVSENDARELVDTLRRSDFISALKSNIENINQLVAHPACSPNHNSIMPIFLLYVIFVTRVGPFI